MSFRVRKAIIFIVCIWSGLKKKGYRFDYDKLQLNIRMSVLLKKIRSFQRPNNFFKDQRGLHDSIR